MTIMRQLVNDSKQHHRAAFVAQVTRQPPQPLHFRTSRGRLRRAAVVVTAVLAWAVVVGLLAWAIRDAADRLGGPDPARPEDAVTVLAGMAGLLVAAWLALGVVLTLLAAAGPGSWPSAVAGALAVRIAPAGLRRAVVLAVGVGLVGAAPALASPARPGVGLVGPGAAAPVAVSAGLDPAWVPSVPGSSGLDPGWVPTPTPSELAIVRAAAGQPAGPLPTTPVRASSAAATGPAPSQQVTLPGPGVRSDQQDRRDGEVVVVRRGDCLWDLAARHLGPDADATRIAAEWPRWYEANRALIGDHPDLLEPGQRLRPPTRPTPPTSPDRTDRQGGPS
jgi:nucleoid-associated protein YgaU